MKRGRRRRFLAVLATLLLVVAFAAGCHAILGLDDPTVVHDDAAADSPGVDAFIPSDGPGNADAGSDVADADAADVVITYNDDWDNPTYWNSIDLSKINVGTSSFAGGVFDGRYVYFPPSSNTVQNAFAARYDTLGNKFTVVASWDFFDTASLNPDARGFESSFFDGRYVYFVPFASPTLHVGLMVRYDTKSAFGFSNPLAWETFDITAFNPNAKGFMGGVFDGQNTAYMAPGTGIFPEGDGGRPQAIVARFDTTPGGFKSQSSYTFFDTQLIAPERPRGFFGTILTNDHLYLIPYGYGGPSRGRVVRYARSKSFTDASSWEMFDTALMNADAVGFNGGAYDGRYIYFVPFINNTIGFHGNVTRYDTQKPFGNTASWEILDTTTLDGGVSQAQIPPDGGPIHRRGYSGAGFDGRYVYLVPYSISEYGHGWVARFDTREPLSSATAWKFYNVATLNPDAISFVGAVFDGQYMYFVPAVKSVVVRFYAKYPAQMPPFLRGGSFL
jgi:hypothetical protein